ncbi:MAG: tyrosine-type recombinase/integrase, partial [Candidatus Xenobia bacterium]
DSSTGTGFLAHPGAMFRNSHHDSCRTPGPHYLRHDFSSRLAMQGVQLRTLQELLGHRTVQMTLRYSHLSPEHQHSAVAKLVDKGDQ